MVIDFSKYPIGQRVVLQNLQPKNNIDFANTTRSWRFDVVAEPSTLDGNTIPDQLNPDIDDHGPDRGRRGQDAQVRVHSQARPVDDQRPHVGRTWSTATSRCSRPIPASTTSRSGSSRTTAAAGSTRYTSTSIDFKILDRNGAAPVRLREGAEGRRLCRRERDRPRHHALRRTRSASTCSIATTSSTRTTT